MRSGERRGRRLAAGGAVALVLALAAVSVGTAPPAGASPDGWSGTALATVTGDISGTLDAVSCPAAGSCVAVGSVSDAAGNDHALVATLAGGSWTQSTLPDPTGFSDMGAVLLSVSCVSTTSCVAVGEADGLAVPLVALLSGSTWSDTTLPITGGISISANLSGVSCWAAGACLAAGQADGQHPLVETLTAGVWLPTVLPLPAGIPAGGLNAVSCPSATDCAAAGFTEDADGDTSGLVLTSDGTTWTPTTDVAPTGISDSSLTGIDCVAATTCQVVGNVPHSPGGPGPGYAEAVTGGVPGPPTFFSDYPGAVSCSSATSCVAAGAPSQGTAPLLDVLSGPTWSQATVAGVPTGSVLAASCVPGGDCWATGQTGAGAPLVATDAAAVPHGYWLVARDGGVFTFGQATFHGSAGDLSLRRPIVGMTPTADHGGYWMVAADGGMFSYGDARFHGSLPQLGYQPAGSGLPHALAAPIVAMVASPDGGGYLLVGSDGGVFAFGDALYHGSCPAIGGCSGPVVAVVPTGEELGYWVVTATGHVYDFGNAAAVATGAPAPPLPAPITAASATADGGGYFLVDALGDVDRFGDAVAYGHRPSEVVVPRSEIVGLVPDDNGTGYWLAGATGAVYPAGDAPADGSMAGRPLAAPVVTAAGF